MRTTLTGFAVRCTLLQRPGAPVLVLLRGFCLPQLTTRHGPAFDTFLRGKGRHATLHWKISLARECRLSCSCARLPADEAGLTWSPCPGPMSWPLPVPPALRRSGSPSG